MFDINYWLSVMLGPDCWDYFPEKLGVVRNNHYGTMASSGQRYGIDPVLLKEQPISKSIK